MTNKRDLHTDLTLCERATPGPWKLAAVDPELVVQDREDGKVVWIAGCDFGKDQPKSRENARFIAEAREGWPHAIRRAIEAERRVEELEQKIERYEEFIKKVAELDLFPANPFRIEARQVLEGEGEHNRMKANVKLINGEELTITGNVVSDLFEYFTKEQGVHYSVPIGWVTATNGDKIISVNFAHVMSITIEDGEEGE